MPDRWLVLTVRVPSDELATELSEGLVALGGSSVLVDGDTLVSYLAPPADVGTFLADAGDRLRGIANGDAEISWRWEADQDWSARWRDGLAPRRVGRRLVVTQPWNDVEAAGADAVVVVIDPATAFGTGEHATTRGVLRLIEQVLEGGERVLDVGTGSGILALAAAGLGAGSVLAVESDASSLSNARGNLDRSQWAARIELVHGDVDAAFLEDRGDRRFDLIVANVLSGALVPLLPAFVRALKVGGHVILGGILEPEAPLVLAAAGTVGLALDAEDTEEGWWSVRLRPVG